MAAPNVKFPREIREGMRGKDVIGHKRAISRARPDLYEWTTFTDYAGDYFMDAVVKWKRSKGLGTTRVLGGRAHEALERTKRKGTTDEWAFDSRAIQLCEEYWKSVSTTPEERVREAIVDAGMFWYGYKWDIAYSQYRPFALGKPPWKPMRWDCSGFVTACYYAGGAPDPNGRGYDNLGYTGTLMGRGTRLPQDIRNCKPGDLIFYGSSRVSNAAFGYGDPTHVGIYVGYIGGVHMTLQLGSYPMKYTRYNYRSDIHHYRRYTVA